MDTLDEISHSLNPFNPAVWVEAGWEFQGGDGEEFDDELFDTEVVTDDGTIEDILELEGAELWFAEVDLEDEIGDEEIALVQLSVDDPTENDSIWALVTEDDEWRLFFQAEVDDPPENLEEVFEDESSTRTTMSSKQSTGTTIKTRTTTTTSSTMSSGCKSSSPTTPVSRPTAFESRRR